MMKKNEIIIFETSDKRISLPVSVDNDTVWLSANQMAMLFERDEKTIRKHINNVFAEGEVENENNTQKMRVDGVKQCLVSGWRKMIDDRTLVALTIMIAESNPEEKEMMISVIMNCMK